MIILNRSANRYNRVRTDETRRNIKDIKIRDDLVKKNVLPLHSLDKIRMKPSGKNKYCGYSSKPITLMEKRLNGDKNIKKLANIECFSH